MSAQTVTGPILEVQNLSRHFGHGAGVVKAVDNVSFDVQPGEILAVVGESGSGKTTLGRLLLRLLEPTSGTILLKGKEVTGRKQTTEVKQYWRQVQAVFQDPFAAFNQFYTIEHVLGKSLNILEKRISNEERRDRIETALREVGLNPNDVLAKWPHQLSGGQVQRVMMARALVAGPDILVADEPTSMLDASLRVTVLNQLKQLQRLHNMSILFITHDLGQAYYIADRILVMYHGQMVEQGRVETVLANPQHDYTKRLLADVPRMRGKRDLLQNVSVEDLAAGIAVEAEEEGKLVE
jgi:peptide/nickel transport system ATP-binding protein